MARIDDENERVEAGEFLIEQLRDVEGILRQYGSASRRWRRRMQDEPEYQREEI